MEIKRFITHSNNNIYRESLWHVMRQDDWNTVCGYRPSMKAQEETLPNGNSPLQHVRCKKCLKHLLSP